MRLEILGSGGAVTTPKPFCGCETCTEARGGPVTASRLGPSVFVHGPDILIDTPEEIFVQLGRSPARGVGLCLYSHWHPDHTSGKRVFEMNKDWMNRPPRNRTTPVVVTETVAWTFGQFLGLAGHFGYLASQGLVDLKVIADDGVYEAGGFTLRPVRMAQDYSFGWDIRGEGKALLVVMDELKDWKPTEAVMKTRYDLVYLPLGILDVNPLTGKRNIHPDHPVLAEEQTADETLDIVRTLDAARFVLGHIEEPDGVTFSMGERLGDLYSRRTGKRVDLAFDTMMVEV